jgi:selenium metabolism protein YedF
LPALRVGGLIIRSYTAMGRAESHRSMAPRHPCNSGYESVLYIHSYYSFAQQPMFAYTMFMDTLDLRGMTCPVPVIETKKFLESKIVEEIEVTLDNEVATENVTRFLSSRGFAVSSETEVNGPICKLRATKAVAGVEQAKAATKKLLVFIAGETIGRGDDELGRVLMKSFLTTLKDLDAVPWRIILINGGVKLAARGSEYVDLLTHVSDLGAEILACGTCLDFFHLKDRLGVGKVSNMHEISSSFLEATNVIRP